MCFQGMCASVCECVCVMHTESGDTNGDRLLGQGADEAGRHVGL